MGLEPTLIRHLADARGNTLLHSAVKSDHVSVLEWLLSILSPHGLSEPALADQNQAGRTVLLSTLKVLNINISIIHSHKILAVAPAGQPNSTSTQ